MNMFALLKLMARNIKLKDSLQPRSFAFIGILDYTRSPSTRHTELRDHITESQMNISITSKSTCEYSSMNDVCKGCLDGWIVNKYIKKNKKKSIRPVFSNRERNI